MPNGFSASPSHTEITCQEILDTTLRMHARYMPRGKRRWLVRQMQDTLSGAGVNEMLDVARRAIKRYARRIDKNYLRSFP